ncbi:hypothetical protein B0H13DRAFT_2556826 [Mycena leptocephala]|nr:hypothetical protein B0H13DRAFT_2556826 [Mycena leptocephala]
MGAGIGRDAELHNDKEALRVVIIAERFLPKIDGSTTTLAHLPQHLAATRVHAMLLSPESGMREYAGARLFGTFGVPLRVYLGWGVFYVHFYSFIFPSFLRALRVIHLVDPIWLGVLARRAGPHRAADTLSEHTDRDEPLYEFANVPLPPTIAPGRSTHACTTPQGERHPLLFPTDSSLFSCPPSSFLISSSPPYTLGPFPSTAGLLREKGWGNGGNCGWWNGRVDRRVFSIPFHAPYAAVPQVDGSLHTTLPIPPAPAPLVFVGTGPYLSMLQILCAQLDVDAVLMGQLTGRRLGGGEECGFDEVRCAFELLYFWEEGVWGEERSGVRLDCEFLIGDDFVQGRSEGVQVRVWEEEQI